VTCYLPSIGRSVRHQKWYFSKNRLWTLVCWPVDKKKWAWKYKEEKLIKKSPLRVRVDWWPKLPWSGALLYDRILWLRIRVRQLSRIRSNVAYDYLVFFLLATDGSCFAERDRGIHLFDCGAYLFPNYHQDEFHCRQILPGHVEYTRNHGDWELLLTGCHYLKLIAAAKRSNRAGLIGISLLQICFGRIFLM